MSMVERLGEGVARRMDRRRFLTRAATGTFGAVAAWTVQGLGASPAFAAVCSHTSSRCSCTPCANVHCRALNTSYCSGSACAGGCSYNYNCGYPDTACWCTETCCGPPAGYYQCCDCLCPGNRACSCRKFVRTHGC